MSMNMNQNVLMGRSRNDRDIFLIIFEAIARKATN